MKTLILIIFTFAPALYAQTLKVVTFNVWSGVDYRGTFYYNEYESEETRQQRFDLLINALKKLDADIILLQEVTPVGSKSKILAEQLNMDEIHITVNSGVKLFGLGMPSNLDEGLVILAKKEYNLELYDAVKLYGATGAHGNCFSFHLDEANFMLIGKIMIDDTPVYIANTHLISSADESKQTLALLNEKFSAGFVDSLKYQEVIDLIVKKSDRRYEEVEDIIDYFSELGTKSAVIIGGDFNADFESKDFELFEKNGYHANEIKLTTWNQDNPNVELEIDTDKQLADTTDIREIENYLSNSISRQLDYIFINSKFDDKDIINQELLFTDKIKEVQLSDHYGLMSEIALSGVISNTVKEYSYFTDYDDKSITPLPIVSYDTDVGLGLGGKCFFLNQLDMNESFDIILFGSTLGERWGRLVFSVPDFELRQGKTYPLALDLIVDYDVYLKNRFYGIGSESQVEDIEHYRKEPLDISLAMSNGITNTFITQSGLRYKTVKNSNFDDSSSITELGGLNTGRVFYTSIFGNAAYDTRNSYIKPSEGILAKIEAEWAPNSALNNVSFSRLSGELQGFTTIFYPTTVLAGRVLYQTLFGNNLPIQVLLPVGGNKTLRGYIQDRFLDMTSTVVNLELRLPLYWRFGLIVGADMGGVSSTHNFMPDKFLWNSVVGLRLDLDTFLVRLDLGFSKEMTGFYLNFNHMF